MALRGSVLDFPVTDIVELAYRHRKTGTLTVRGAYSRAYVVFQQGLIVWADATRQPLGTLLIRAGLITVEQQDAALDAQKNAPQSRFGDLLVEQGTLTRAQLEDFVRLMVREAVFRVMLATTGDYEFETGKLQGEATLDEPLDPQHMLMDAVRMADEWPRLQKIVRGLGGVPRRAEGAKAMVNRPEPDTRFGTGLDEEDAIVEDGGAIVLGGAKTVVWDLVDGERSTQQIVDRSCLGIFLAFKCLAALHKAGLIAGAPPVEERGSDRTDPEFIIRETD